MLSIAAPFNRAAAFPAGDVTVRDVAGLYIFDNTLLAIKFTGAQVRTTSSSRRATSSRSRAPARSLPTRSPTRRTTATAPNGTPDYNYDIMGGLDAPLTYDIDIAQPVGSADHEPPVRGRAGDADQAVRHRDQQLPPVRRRQLPRRDDGPVVYNAQVEIRQLLIDWVTANKVIDPTQFSTLDWRLVANGQPVTITG